MTMQEGVTYYTLKRSLPYQFEGSTHAGRFLELREPGMEHCSTYFKIRQMLTRASVDVMKTLQGLDQGTLSTAGTEVKQPHEITDEELQKEAEDASEALSMALHMSREVDISEFLREFADMACMSSGKSICIVDGKIAMTKAIWASMAPDDAMNAAVRWASFFATPDALGSSSSETPSG